MCADLRRAIVCREVRWAVISIAYQSVNYESATNRIDIEVDIALGCIKVISGCFPIVLKNPRCAEFYHAAR